MRANFTAHRDPPTLAAQRWASKTRPTLQLPFSFQKKEKAKRRRPPHSKEPLLHLAAGQVAEVLEQVRQRRHQLAPVVLDKTLVGGVSVALRVLDAHQQGRGPAEQVGQWADKADGSTATDAD